MARAADGIVDWQHDAWWVWGTAYVKLFGIRLTVAPDAHFVRLPSWRRPLLCGLDLVLCLVWKRPLDLLSCPMRYFVMWGKEFLRGIEASCSETLRSVAAWQTIQCKARISPSWRHIRVRIHRILHCILQLLACLQSRRTASGTRLIVARVAVVGLVHVLILVIWSFRIYRSVVALRAFTILICYIRCFYQYKVRRGWLLDHPLFGFLPAMNRFLSFPLLL